MKTSDRSAKYNIAYVYSICFVATLGGLMFGFVFLSNIPESIFVNDTGEILVLDHVEATIVKCDKNSISLKVTNPTPYDAQVSVLSENGAQAKAPPGMYSYLNRKKIEVKSGQTAIFVISN